MNHQNVPISVNNQYSITESASVNLTKNGDFHPDFQSYDPSITNASELGRIMKRPFLYQMNYKKYTTRSEISMWNKEELQLFQIDIATLDRLYVMETEIFEEELQMADEYRMVARVKCKGEPLYISLFVTDDICHINGSCSCTGSVYVSRNPILFMRDCLSSNDLYIDSIFASLKRDGVNVEGWKDLTFCNINWVHHDRMIYGDNYSEMETKIGEVCQPK